MNRAAIPLGQSERSDAVLADIVEEVTNKLQAGEPVDVEGYVEANPDLADQLRQILPALHILANLGHSVASRNPLSVLPIVARPAELGELGDFRIVREVGRGGMGIVYEAVQISLNRRVALKVLPFAAAMDPKQLQRFKNEAQAAAHLHHTDIVPVHAVGCERGVHYYAMQFIDGQTVAAVIRDLRQNVQGPRTNDQRMTNDQYPSPGANPQTNGGHSTLDILWSLDIGHSSFFRTVAYLGVQAAEALEHAHGKGIIHRDIKPANLLVDLEGNLWITDFGLARILSEAGLTMTGDLVGTLRYMSPEQALAKRVPVDHRTDIYSLGVTLYELLTLRPAYDGADRQEVLQQIAFEEPRLPRRVNKAIPAELEIIVRKAIGKNPSERYGTAQELADDLRRFLDDKPIRAKKPTVADAVRKWARRHQGVVVTGIVGLIAAVGILAASLVLIWSAYRREAYQLGRAETNLYHSRVEQARILRQGRNVGYRDKAWRLLQQALQSQTPEQNRMELRQEAVACMGDFVGLEPTTWKDFPTNLTRTALHPNGVQIALGLADGTILLRDLATGAEIDRLQHHHCTVSALLFSPDGRWLVSGDSQGTIQVCAVQAGGKWGLVRTLRFEPRVRALLPSAVLPGVSPWFDLPYIHFITISPNGKYLAAAIGYLSSTTPIAVWDLTSGSQIAVFSSKGAFEKYDGWLVFSPKSNSLAASCKRFDRLSTTGFSKYSHSLIVWDMENQRAKQELALDEFSFVNEIAYSPDGKFLACACLGGIAIFNASTLQPYLFRRGDGVASALAFHPDSRLLAVGFENQRVRLLDILNDRELAALDHPGSPHAVAFSKDGKRLVAASHQAVRQWNLAGSGENRVLLGHQKAIPGVAFRPTGNFIASAGWDGKVRIWDPATGQLVKELSGFGYSVHAVAFSPDGSLLATGDWAGGVKLWDVKTWKLLASPEHESGSMVLCVAFSPDGHFLAAGGQGCLYASKGGITLWRVLPSRPGGAGPSLQRMAGPPDSGYVCGIALDLDYLAWVRDDHLLGLWDMRRSREAPFPRLRLASRDLSVSFLPDGKHLTFVPERSVPEVWSCATGQRIFSFEAGRWDQDRGIGVGGKIALSGDGARLASASGSLVSIWDAHSGKFLLTLPEEQSNVCSLAWSPDRKQLATGSADGRLTIWNLPKIKAQLDEIGLGW